MSKNVVVKFVEKLLRKIYKGRRISLKKVGKRWRIVAHDVLDNLQFSLSGAYSYNEVVKLNEITGYTARFGYCPKLGSIAFIGIPNPNFDFSFFREINSKERRINKGELEFKKYESEEVEKNSYYQVYGLHGVFDLKNIVKYDKIASVCDTQDVRRI